ncbi:class I SAM-dependent methyltransferase [Paenibacillus alvei]|uniref:class I SAM-dependent methyltransferase n=1 Tax=Paenibacillus alvei TaxID=44250 RepID=UPI00228235FE|nr:class I SAM-dependent methyltransferase [Paenibacillus alvei]
MRQDIVDYYTGFDEWGRLERESLEFRINWHYMKRYLPSQGEVLDNGAGPGRYAMELARSGYQVTLTDLTPASVDFAENKAAELDLTAQFRGFYAADARKLHMLPNEQYDAALMLGPLYHLQEEEERAAAAEELYRVTKPGGIVFVAFRPRLVHTLLSLKFPQNWKPLDNVEALQDFLHTGIFNHADKGRFTGAYFYKVEEIMPFMREHGFEGIQLISSSGLGGNLTPEQWQYWSSRGEQELERLYQLLYDTAADPSLLGTGTHLLYIGKKIR